MSLYNLRKLFEDTYMICKFDDDFVVESTYTLTAKGFSYTCNCPANNRAVIIKPCRHKLMMPTLLGEVDTDKFYDYETALFCTPLGDLLAPVVGEALRNEPSLLPELKQEVTHTTLFLEQPAGALGVSIQQAQAGVVEQPQPPLPSSTPQIMQDDWRYAASICKIETDMIVTPVLVTSDLPAPTPTIRRR